MFFQVAKPLLECSAGSTILVKQDKRGCLWEVWKYAGYQRDMAKGAKGGRVILKFDEGKTLTNKAAVDGSTAHLPDGSKINYVLCDPAQDAYDLAMRLNARLPVVGTPALPSARSTTPACSASARSTSAAAIAAFGINSVQMTPKLGQHAVGKKQLASAVCAVVSVSPSPSTPPTPSAQQQPTVVLSRLAEEEEAQPSEEVVAKAGRHVKAPPPPSPVPTVEEDVEALPSPALSEDVEAPPSPVPTEEVAKEGSPPPAPAPTVEEEDVEAPPSPALSEDVEALPSPVPTVVVASEKVVQPKAKSPPPRRRSPEEVEIPANKPLPRRTLYVPSDDEEDDDEEEAKAPPAEEVEVTPANKPLPRRTLYVPSDEEDDEEEAKAPRAAKAPPAAKAPRAAKAPPTAKAGSSRKQPPCNWIPWSKTRGDFFTKGKGSLLATLPLMYHLAGGRDQWADKDIWKFTAVIEDTYIASTFIEAWVAKSVGSVVTNAAIRMDDAGREKMRQAAARAGVKVVRGLEGKDVVENPPQRIVFTPVPNMPKTFAITFTW